MIVIRWDWKDEPNWDKINTALLNWEGPVFFTRAYTDSDSYAVVMAHAELTESEANRVYDNYIRG